MRVEGRGGLTASTFRLGTLSKYTTVKVTAKKQTEKETTEARRQLNSILKVPQKKTCQPKILPPGKISLRDEGKRKPFLKEENIDFVISRPALQRNPKEISLG